MATFQQYNLYPCLTPVRLVSTANVTGTYFNGITNNGVGATLTIAASSLTVDSVVAAVGDRILLSAQTNANENGIYVVLSIGTTVVLQRAADMQNIEQIHIGFFVSVGAGSVNAGNTYAIVEPLPAIFGISNLVLNAQAAAGNVTFSGPASTANALAVFADTAGNLKAASTTTTLGQSLSVTGTVTGSTGLIATTGNITASAGNLVAGASGAAGTVGSFPAVATSGELLMAAVTNAGGNFNTTISNASSVGQAQVISIPDSGASTANFLLDKGIGAAISVNNLKYGATPVAQVDPGSCTIAGAAGAANHCTITIQLKDGSGTNMARVIPFKVYLATDATGLTLQSAASTGYSVTSGGVTDPTGSTTITQGLAAFSSATGGCVVDLLDTGKGTGNLILMFSNGFKASAAITAGSYG